MSILRISQKVWQSLDPSSHQILEQDSQLRLVRDSQGADFELCRNESNQALEISAIGKDWVPLSIDFDDPKWKRRWKDPLRWRDPLVRAVGLKSNAAGLRIWDLTAGLGSDAYFLAGLGARVNAWEKSAPLYLLQADAWRRASFKPELKFHLGDSLAELQGKRVDCDVIYLDPMFQVESKKALPPREMQFLRLLLPPESPEKLIAAALERGAPRTVIKLPLHAEVPFKRHSSVEGKSHRFDIFIRAV